VVAGDLGAAERELRESVATLDAIGDKGFLSTIVCDLAEVLATQGKLDEAERYADQGRSLGATDDIVTQIEWRAVKAKVLSARGEMQEAERLAREAVALGEATDYLTQRAESLMRLSEVLRRAGKAEEAAEAMARALELYERKGNEVMAARVRAELSVM